MANNPEFMASLKEAANESQNVNGNNWEVFEKRPVLDFSEHAEIIELPTGKYWLENVVPLQKISAKDIIKIKMKSKIVICYLIPLNGSTL